MWQSHVQKWISSVESPQVATISGLITLSRKRGLLVARGFVDICSSVVCVEFWLSCVAGVRDSLVNHAASDKGT